MTGSGDQIKDLFQEAQRRWLKPSEVFNILDHHDSNLISTQAPHLPPSGSLFLFNKKILPSFRVDGHTWRKKKYKNSVLESHVSLVVNNAKNLDCYYAQREDNRNFQRRSYWMLDQEKKHIVLVHYRDITDLQGETNPASASGQSYNLSQIDNGFPLGNQGTASLNGMHGSNQSLCSLVTEQQIQQCIDSVNDFNGYGSVGTSRDVDGNPLWQALEQFGLNCDIARETMLFDPQKHDTDGTTNSAVLGDYNHAEELVESATFPHDRYCGGDDGMVSDLTFPAATWGDIGSLLVPQEAENFVDMDTYIPAPGELQMALEVDPSLEIVSKHKFTISEISPQWGFADEATKVFIIGSFLFDPSSSAFAMFDDAEVPIQIIQDGVICCEAPPRRSAGKIPFCITSGNRESCSEVKDFEYRDRNSICNNCIKSQQEENRSMEEVQLIVRFLQMLLSNSSLQKEECAHFNMNPTDPLQPGCGTSSGTIGQVLQELLEDKLQQWLSARFLEGGGSLNCALSKKEQGIIHVSAALGCEWALKSILDYGVGVNFRDTKGWTALHWAARFGREKMVAALIASGASAGAVTDPTEQDPMGKKPESIADANGHKGLAGFLSELALTSHFASLTLEAGSMQHVEADEVDVRNTSRECGSSGEDQTSMKQVLAAHRNAVQVADLLRDAFRRDSFRKRQQREAANRGSVDAYSFTPDEIQGLSSQLVFPRSHGRTVAAVTIQKYCRGWIKRKGFLSLRRKVVKIQARIRGYRVRKYYRVVWAVGIMEKAVLRWRRRGPGLRGYRPQREPIDENEEDEDIVKDFRRQIVDTVINDAISRVKNMICCPEARNQYTRMLETVRQAKDKLGISSIEEALASVARDFSEDNDTDVAFRLPLEATADSPGYSFELWGQPVC